MKKKEQKVVVKLGVWEWEWERIVELPVCWSRVGRTWRGCRFRHDDLELSVGHPGRFTGERGWVEVACESSEDEVTRDRVSRGPMARTEHQACGAGMRVSVWRDTVVGRGLAGCSWMWVGSRGQA